MVLPALRWADVNIGGFPAALLNVIPFVLVLCWFYLPVQLDCLCFSDSLKNVEASLAHVDASFFLGKVCFLVTGGTYGICPLPPLRAAQLTIAFLRTRQWLNLKQNNSGQWLYQSFV